MYGNGLKQCQYKSASQVGSESMGRVAFIRVSFCSRFFHPLSAARIFRSDSLPPTQTPCSKHNGRGTDCTTINTR